MNKVLQMPRVTALENRLKVVKFWAMALAVSALAACGGGGGGGAPATVSVSDYQLRQAWVNYVTLSGTQRFTISGTISGVAVTGSGTETDGSLVAATFEGKPALSKTVVVTGTLSSSGQSLPYGSTGVGYVDSNYMPLGQSGNEYAVVTGTPVIPQTAKINDTGTLYTATRYPTSQKSYSIGTLTVSYALQPDTAYTALLKVITTRKTTSGSTYSTDISTFKMTPAGALTPVYEQYQDSSSALTITF